jgi:hypothetical protein
MNTTVKNQLIKIAYENPELRDELLPLINKEANTLGQVILLGALASTWVAGMANTILQNDGQMHPPAVVESFGKELEKHLFGDLKNEPATPAVVSKALGRLEEAKANPPEHWCEEGVCHIGKPPPGKHS